MKPDGNPGQDEAPTVVPDPHSQAAKDSQVRDMFSRIAPTYDLLNRLLSLGIDRRWRRYALRKVSKPSPARVLDLCGGTGDMTLQMLKLRSGDRFALADFSFSMLQKAAARFKQMKQPIPLCCVNAMAMPFKDASFDVCLCAFGVRNWSVPEKGIREVHRTLKADGEFVILDFLKAGAGFSDWLGRLYIHHILPAVGRLVSGDPHAYRYLANSMEGFYSEQEFREVMCRNGFALAAEKRFFLGMCWLFIYRKTEPTMDAG